MSKAAVGVACCALCAAACASAWTMSVRAQLQSPAPAACVEQTLMAQEVVDTTLIVADRQELLHDSATGSYAEVAFVAAGSRGRIAQTRDVLGDPLVMLSWTWSETLPQDDSIAVVENWLLSYLDTMLGECAGGSPPENLVVLRTWTLPDSAR